MRKGKNFKFVLQIFVFALVAFTLTRNYLVKEVVKSPIFNNQVKEVKQEPRKPKSDDVLHPIDEYIGKNTIEGSKEVIKSPISNKQVKQEVKQEPRKQKSDDVLHPIDEYIGKNTIEGSSLRTALTLLKGHSLPEAYGDAIDTEEDIATEKSRCARYGFDYNPIIKKRRRIFMGSLIADDSWHVIAAHAAEAYGLYHTVALVESNTTQTMTKRKTNFDKGSLNYKMLQSGIFGPKTDVYVDFRVDVAKDYPDINALRRENIQREGITERWKAAGMQPDDVGIVCDIDEVFTRDFLLALQTCDIPRFRPGNDCRVPHITGQGLKFEFTPDCSFASKFGGERYFRRALVVMGECIDKVGDSDLHPPSPVVRGGQKADDFIGKRNFSEHPELKMYPLWIPWDFRRAPHQLVLEEGRLHTAYHFHNFFDSFDVLKNKYETFAHNREDAVSSVRSLGGFQAEGIRCLTGEPGKYDSYDEIEGRRPILYNSKVYRTARTTELRKEVEDDELSRSKNL